MKPSLPVVPVLPSVLTAAVIAVDGSMPRRHTAAHAIRDGLITAKVKMRLGAGPLTHACDIHVETFQGSVQLSGFVETVAVRTAALGLARDVEGVQLVEDLLDTRNVD
jgi:hyperosmotically inducible protein